MSKQSKKPKYYVRPDGLHEAIRQIDGKRVAFRGRSDAEAEQKMIAYHAAARDGRPFSKVADAWWNEHEPTIEENTKKGYRPAYRRAKEQFGDIPIKTIRPQDVQKFINVFARGRSQKTATNQLLILNLIFSYAVVHGDAENNPCTYVKIPRGLSKRHREAASPQDEAIAEAYAKTWLFPFLILCTGLRKGEALALTDQDFGEEWITVSKSVYHVSNQPRIKVPKTDCGERMVPLLDRLLPYLPKRWKAYLFSNDGGKTPLSETQYQRYWEVMRFQTGITCTAHQLRHSYASFIYDRGVRDKDAQDLLGHAQLSTTSDIYTHLRNDRRKKTAQLLNQKTNHSAS